MKNILIVSAMFALAAVTAQAQGTIRFSNTGTTKVTTNTSVGGGANGVMTISIPYRFALFSSTTATSVNGQTTAILGAASSNYAFNDTNWTLVAYGSNISLSGMFASASATANATTVPGVPFGSSAQFVVIGWSLNAGTTIAAVQSWLNGGNPGFPGWIGQSDVSSAITLTTPTLAGLFGSNGPVIKTGFTLGLATSTGPVAPTITSQPTNVTVPVGANASFSANAYGNPSPAYQWMFNTNNVIPGATGPTLNLSNVQLTNAGTYSVVITNNSGTTNSFAATLTVTNSTANGFVIFANGTANGTPAPSATKIYTNSAVGGAATGLTTPGGRLYYYGLYASSNAASVNGQTAAIVGAASTSYAFNDANWALVAWASNVTNTSGGSTNFRGQLSSLNANGAGRTPVPGFGAGTSARFVVIGWSANVAATNIESVQIWFNGGNPASDGWIGQSAVSGSLVLGNGGAIPTPQLFGTAAPYLQGFTLGLASPVPAAAYQVPYAPPAVVQASVGANSLQLSWPTASGSFSVQLAPTPAGPWSDTGLTVTSDGTTSSATVPNPVAGLYYRLVAQ